MPLARRLRRIEDNAAEASGLTMWQYAVLADAETRPGSIQTEVAARLQYDKNRLVTDLDILENLGLVERQRGSDRRSYGLYVTASGSRMRRTIQARIHRGEDELLGDLPTTTRERLATTLAATASHILQEH